MHVWLRVLSNIWCRHNTYTYMYVPMYTEHWCTQVNASSNKSKENVYILYNQLTPRVYNLLICCLFQHFSISSIYIREILEVMSAEFQPRGFPPPTSPFDVTQRSEVSCLPKFAMEILPWEIPPATGTYAISPSEQLPWLLFELAPLQKKVVGSLFKWPWNLYIGKSNVTLEPSGSNCLKSSTTRGSSPLNIKAWSEHRGSLYDFQT